MSEKGGLGEEWVMSEREGWRMEGCEPQEKIRGGTDVEGGAAQEDEADPQRHQGGAVQRGRRGGKAGKVEGGGRPSEGGEDWKGGQTSCGGMKGERDTMVVGRRDKREKKRGDGCRRRRAAMRKTGKDMQEKKRVCAQKRAGKERETAQENEREDRRRQDRVAGKKREPSGREREAGNVQEKKGRKREDRGREGGRWRDEKETTGVVRKRGKKEEKNAGTGREREREERREEERMGGDECKRTRGGENEEGTHWENA